MMVLPPFSVFGPLRAIRFSTAIFLLLLTHQVEGELPHQAQGLLFFMQRLPGVVRPSLPLGFTKFTGHLIREKELDISQSFNLQCLSLTYYSIQAVWSFHSSRQGPGPNILDENR